MDAAADEVADMADGGAGGGGGAGGVGAASAPAILLVRLFVKLPELLARTNLSTDEAAALTAHLGGFIKWLAARRETLLPAAAYKKASSAYIAAANAQLAGSVAISRVPFAKCYED